ncbi:MAG TPA: STAS domain-containing protein [Spirochaetota bacterium]|nr:STAS domain-containing protein [Spirochaetota bacterium]
MPLDYTKTENVVIIYPSGRLDIEQSSYLEIELEKLVSLEKESNFLFNMAGVDYVNSYSLKMILNTYLDLRNKGRHLAVCNINSVIRKLLNIIGHDDMFEVFNSEAEGVDFLSAK